MGWVAGTGRETGKLSEESFEKIAQRATAKYTLELAVSLSIQVINKIIHLHIRSNSRTLKAGFCNIGIGRVPGRR